MVKKILLYWLSIVGRYFSGSVLFGYVIPKTFKNIDVCEVSCDGNPGTYNAFKYGGFTCGVLSLTAELLKGFLPVYLCGKVLGDDSFLFSFVMAAPVIGHACSVFYHGKGGKAIAVSFGVLLGLFPEMRPLLILIAFYLLFSLFVPIKDHGKRTMAAFACFVVMSCFFVKSKYILLGNVIIACTVIYKHRINAGGEHSNEGSNSFM